MAYKKYNLVDTNRVQQERIQQMFRSLDSSCLSVYNQKRHFIRRSSAAVVALREPKPAIEKPIPNFTPYFNTQLDKSALLKSIEPDITPDVSTELPPLPPPSTLFTENYITSVIPILDTRAIEYKKVNAKYFNDSEKDFEAVDKLFSFTGDYMAKEFIGQLELGKRDTTIVNIGTGNGKTFTSQHLIQFYAENGYVVILACPFILLINENFNKLKNKLNPDIKIVNYANLDEKNLDEYVRANIHCLTINCLMGNPGGDSEPHKGSQTGVKKNYLDDLQKYCIDNNKEIIIFFDELHAGIHNFNPWLLGNLYRWKSLVKKVFVFSATYTEASNIVLGYLAKKLTNKKMTIYNCDRRKFPTQANLHINITKKRYTSKDIAPLFYLKNVIEQALENNQKINILVATKSLVQALTNPDSLDPLAQYICSLKLNILVGNENSTNENNFNPLGNNIGTTFGTGISIDDHSAYIIVTPVFVGPDSQKLASIFMNGSPAIVQSFARLRNGGNIHVFMNKPSHLIVGDYIKTLPPFLKDLQSAWYKDSNDQSRIVENAYNSHNKHIRNLAQFGKIDWKKLFFTTREQFILSRSQYELSSNYEIFGKKVNPYIIWASYHNQFTNCTLKTINLIAEPTDPIDKVEVFEKSIIPDLRKLLRDDIEVRIQELTDKDALILLFNAIHMHRENGVIDPQRKEIIYKGKSVKFEHSKYHPAITKALINILYQLKHGTEFNCNTSNYIQGNIYLSQFVNYADKNRKRNNLKIAYSILGDVGRILKGNVLFDVPLLLDTIDETLEKKICTALHELRENDFYIRNKIFSFLQTYQFTILRDGSINYKNRDVTERHKILLKALTNIFYESESKPIKVKGKPQRERKITAVKLPPDHPLDLTFGLTLEESNCYFAKKPVKPRQRPPRLMSNQLVSLVK